MARCVLIFLLPLLSPFFLLADASWNSFLPLHKQQENNEKPDSVKHPLLPLPTKSATGIIVEVPHLLRTPWKRVRVPTETKGERVSIEGFKRLRFGRRGGCHFQHGGGILKFRPQGDRLRPQFFFPSSADAHLHGKYDDGAAASSFRSFSTIFPQSGNEGSGFEPRGRGFPERQHSHSHSQEEHEKRDGPGAPWTEWLRSLFPRLSKLL